MYIFHFFFLITNCSLQFISTITDKCISVCVYISDKVDDETLCVSDDDDDDDDHHHNVFVQFYIHPDSRFHHWLVYGVSKKKMIKRLDYSKRRKC